VSLPFFLALVMIKGGFRALAAPKLSFLIIRGLILASGNLAFYLALATIPLADAVSIYFTMPFFVAAIAAPALGEKVRLYRWYAILAGFIGVIVMTKPGLGVFQPAALLALWSAFAYGIGQTMARPLAGIVSSPVMAFYQNLVYLVVALALAAIFADGTHSGTVHPSLHFLAAGWQRPSQFDLELLAMFGVLSVTVMLLFVHGYKVAEVNFVAPFEYTAIFWAILWGIALFGDYPDLWGLLGAGIVIGAGLFMIHMDRVYRARGLVTP
jgi:drug/metabolite transporter (DMT)-like permease